MEENKEEEKKVEEKVEKNNEAKVETTAEKDTGKSARKVVKVVIIAIVAVLAILILLDLLMRSPKETATSFYKKLLKEKADSAFNYIDLTGYYTIKNYLVSDSDNELEDYDDFWEDYQDALDDSDVEDYVEEFQDNLDDYADTWNDNIEEMKDEGYKIKVKKVKNVEKLTDHLYEVKVVLEYVGDDEEESDTVSLYIMKKGLKSYVVYFSGLDSAVGYSSSQMKEDLSDSNYYYNY